MSRAANLVARALALPPPDDRELHLLIDCARASVESDRAARISERCASGVDWDRLWRLARRHGLAPLLYTHLSRICASHVPEARLEELRDFVHKNSALSLLLTGELIRLVTLLNDRGIKAIPYKGPALAVRLYGHIARRQFGDLDILVPERDVWEASRLLEAQGFEPHWPVADDQRDAFIRADYVRVFRRDGGRTVVELHWQIAEPYMTVGFDAAELWPRLEPMALQGTSVGVPCAEDLLLMLCVHGARHIWDKLEGVAAVAELLRQTPALDWGSVWRRAEQMHVRRVLTLGLVLANGLFDTPLPPQAAALARTRALGSFGPRIVGELAAADAPSRSLPQQLSLQLPLKDSYADRMRHCARLFLKPGPDDWAFIKLRRSWSFAYPLVRAFRLARKTLPAQ